MSHPLTSQSVILGSLGGILRRLLKRIGFDRDLIYSFAYIKDVETEACIAFAQHLMFAESVCRK